MIVCQLCLKEFESIKSISRHIFHKHKDYTTKQYYIKFLKKENDGYCIICGKETKITGLGGYQSYCSKSCAQHDPYLLKKRYENYLIKKGFDPKTYKDRPICKCGCGERVIQKDTLYCQGHANRDFNVKQKKIQTSRINNGCDNPFQSEKIKDTIKKTCIKKYGYENPFQCPKIQNKYIETCRKNRGVDWSMQDPLVREKSKHTCKEKYGVENYAKTEHGREISRSNYANLIESQKINNEPLAPRIGIQERPFLNELQSSISFFIHRQNPIIYTSLNNKQVYYPDGHILELKLDRKSTRLNSSHSTSSRMPSSA
jgi:hypothetical protein